MEDTRTHDDHQEHEQRDSGLVVATLAEISRRVRHIADPPAPVRDIVTVTLDGSTETSPGDCGPFMAFTVINRHATASLYVATIDGQARDAAGAGRILPGVVVVGPGRLVTVPVGGDTLVIAGQNAGGSVPVEILRWRHVQPARCDASFGYVLDEVADIALVEGDFAAARIDAKRSVIGVLEDSVVRGQRASVTAAGALKVDPSAVVAPVALQGAASGGQTPFRLISAATTNATLVKNAPGQLYNVLVSNVNAAARFLKLYNKAAAPVVGTDTPIFTFLLPAGGILNIDVGGVGFVFSVGIAFALTALVADADATAVAANEIVVNLGFK